MKLPNMRYTEGAAKREVVALRGLNYGDSLQDGDLVSCENLSARRYPYLSTRRPRARQTAQSGPRRGRPGASWGPCSERS